LSYYILCKIIKKRHFLAVFCKFFAIFFKKLLKSRFIYDKIKSIYEREETKMKISDVRVRIVKKDDSKLKAVASVTFDDCFVVHDIKVIEGTEGYFIAMPSRKTNDGEYKDIAHPIKSETREELISIILNAFEEEKAKPQD
jgi:stage V sporulation protein G